MSRPRPALAGLLDLRDRMNQLFDELVQSREPASGQYAWSPVADVLEGPAGYHLRVELPGVDPTRLEVLASGRSVTVRGRRPYPADASESVHRVERHYGPFARTFELPAPVDAAGLRRRYERGVLSLDVPRAAGG